MRFRFPSLSFRSDSVQAAQIVEKQETGHYVMVAVFKVQREKVVNGMGHFLTIWNGHFMQRSVNFVNIVHCYLPPFCFAWFRLVSPG
jgi:hypothetical protein